MEGTDAAAGEGRLVSWVPTTSACRTGEDLRRVSETANALLVAMVVIQIRPDRHHVPWYYRPRGSGRVRTMVVAAATGTVVVAAQTGCPDRVYHGRASIAALKMVWDCVSA